MSAPGYRPDVDGLRAIAVLAVLAFHAFPGLAPGGFVGVDVFFVISGFLISGIILDGLRRGSFSFADFYWRRIRRIFPALALVLAGSVALGWGVLLPDEFEALGKHVAAGALFVSNFAFWREAGYFDTASELKPLLHLWSLGVEEQFYLVWPLVLFALRRQLGALPWIIAAIAALSFAANLWLTAHKPAAAFYLPMGRFWELAAGALLAYAVRHRPGGGRLADAKSLAGLGLIALSFALVDAERAFPGLWALLPVAGSALVIWAGPRARLNRALLAHPALVYIGLISYPLYLWHWPLFAYARIVHGGEPPVGVVAALCAASVVLAWLTYELVEKRIRFATLDSVRRLSVPALCASMAGLAAAGLLSFSGELGPRSASLPLAREISRAHADWEYGGDRVIPGTTGKAVLFFGDSHMQHYWPRIKQVASQPAAPLNTIILKTAGGCAPVPGIERRGQRCSRFVEQGLRLARRPEVETVIVAASWVGFVGRGDYYRVGDPEEAPLDPLAPQADWVLAGFEAALAELVAAGKRVVIVLSSPRGAVLDPKSLVHRDGMTVRVSGKLAALPRSDLEALAAPIDARLRHIAASIGAELIDPADWLCTAKLCPSVDERGRPLYKDASHLRASAARERFLAIDPYLYTR